MSKAPPKRYRISLTVKDTAMPTIFELLRGDATDFHMQEVLPDQSFGNITRVVRKAVGNGTEPEDRKQPPRSVDWALKMWPQFETVLRQIANSNDGRIYYNDKRIADLLTSMNRSPASVSAIISAFERRGKLKRLERGTYAIV
jgi:hypothetical protein